MPAARAIASCENVIDADSKVLWSIQKFSALEDINPDDFSQLLQFCFQVTETEFENDNRVFVADAVDAEGE